MRLRGSVSRTQIREICTQPLPTAIEDLALRLAWPIVGINLLGTVFGFWYYRFQLADTPLVMWPWVPDSPLATFFMAMSVALWKLGRTNELVNMLAFYGNIKLGLWTPFTLVVFQGDFAYLHPAMFQFLIWSHLLMVAQAFLIHRYSRFSLWAIVGALIWYTVDLTLDYFVPIAGGPHHTWIPTPRHTEMWFGATAVDLIAAAATVLTIWITIVACATHIHKRTYSSA